MSVRLKHKTKKHRIHFDSDGDSEHELYYYANNRVRLMKEVLKVLKLKKIKSLAPERIKRMDMEEMNTLLLEELLGISNKRLKKIFEGRNDDDESSSSDEEKANDIISLDSISDDDIVFIDEKKDDGSAANHKRRKHKRRKVKKEHEEGIKVENCDKTSGLENEQLLNVLELLELQARARAIRSQLALEAEHRAKEEEDRVKHAQDLRNDGDDDDDDVPVVIEEPVVKEIVISSSDSENEKESNTQMNKELSEAIECKTVEAKADDTNQLVVQASNAPKVKLIQSIKVKEAAIVSDIPLPSDVVEKVHSDGNQSLENDNSTIIIIEDAKETHALNAEAEDDAVEKKPVTKLTLDDNVIHLDVVEIDDC